MLTSTLIDYYLPVYNFKEVHFIIIKQPVEKVYPHLKTLDLSSEWIIKFLFKLRRLPVTEFTLSGLVRQMNFTWLAEQENKELLITCWGNLKPQPIANPETFRTNTTLYSRKIAWNFLVQPLDQSSCQVTTETRIMHYTSKAKITFGIYWFFIRPFSGLIRILILKKLRRETMG